MTNRVKPYLLLLAAVAGALSAVSCTTDDGSSGEKGDNADRTANVWVHRIMQEHYLWRDQMPSSVDYELEYRTFFESLLSLEDGKHWFDDEDEDGGYYYSSIQKYVKIEKKNTRAEEDDYEDYYTSSYGFGYRLTKLFVYDERVSEVNRYAKLYATVAWVTKGSQAEKDGLKRGDHIYKINGKELPQEGYRKVLSALHAPLSGSSTVTFTVCQLEPYLDADGNPVLHNGEDIYGNFYPDVPVVTRDPDKDKTRTLTSAFIDEPPLYYSSILTAGNGRRVGYLVYNEFNSGRTTPDPEDDEVEEEGAYDKLLKEAFAIFKSNTISELIIDLRYNPGGEVDNLRTLASLIVPSGYSGRVFQKMVMVDGSEETVNYLSETNTVGLTKVYIIATNYSASASEALIHCLRGSGIEVYHIGSTTEGKNVGQSPRDTEGLDGGLKDGLNGYNYVVYPVTFYIEDAQGNRYASTGIDPAESGGYLYYEEFEVRLKELGDPEEPLLAAALYHIGNGRWPATTRAVGSRSGSTGSLGKGIPRNVRPAKGMILDRRE